MQHSWFTAAFVIHKDLRVDGKVTRVETGAILGAFNRAARLKDLFALEKDVAGQIFTILRMAFPADLAEKETDSMILLLISAPAQSQHPDVRWFATT